MTIDGVVVGRYRLTWGNAKRENYGSETVLAAVERARKRVQKSRQGSTNGLQTHAIEPTSSDRRKEVIEAALNRFITQQVHVSVSADEREAIDRMAAEYGISRSAFVRLCVDYYLDVYDGESADAAQDANH